MAAVLPHYKMGPSNHQVSALIFGGQLVEYTTQTAGTTDLTVKPCVANSLACLGVAAKDANVIASQTGSPNTYGQPAIDISVLDDYTSVYFGGVDIWAWYSAATNPGALLATTAHGTVGPYSGTTYSQIVGRCTHPGGVTAGMLTQAIGGLGAATFFLGRIRIF